MFVWKTEFSNTNVIRHGEHDYHLIANQARDCYRCSLLEDDHIVISCWSNERKIEHFIDNTNDLAKAILLWGRFCLEKYYGKCDNCSKYGVLIDVKEIAKNSTKLNYLKKICKDCTPHVLSIYMQEESDKELELLKPDIKRLKNLNPKIAGGFKNKIDAYKFLIDLDDYQVSEIEDEEGFILAQAILKASDGTYYPVYCVISPVDGGEHWETFFCAENLDELISDKIVLNFLNKKEDDIYPYDYETLAYIDNDFHQKSRFRALNYENVKHHYTNVIDNVREIDITYPFKSRAISVRVKSYLSNQHLLSAAIFTQKIKELEPFLTESMEEDTIIIHRSLCINSLVSSAMFLEASINEFLIDIQESEKEIVSDLDSSIKDSLKRLFDLGIPRKGKYSTIEKYQISLAIAGKSLFDLGNDPAQSVAAVIKLRNALVHYEPEWITTKDLSYFDSDKPKLEKLLKNKFTPNKYTGDDNPFFPDKCFSLGCAIWAIKSTMNFNSEFFIRMGLIPSFEKIRDKVNLLISMEI